MHSKIVAAVMIVLLAASTAAVPGEGVSSCPDRSCCCGAYAPDGHQDHAKVHRLLRACCCQASGGTCSIKEKQPINPMGLTLPSFRTEPTVLLTVGPGQSDTGAKAAATFPLSIIDDAVVPPGSPPTYLTLMSFLC